MGTEESKEPTGEVRQVSHGQDVKVREMRTAETLLNIIQDRGKRQLPLDDVYRQLYNPAMYLRSSPIFAARNRLTFLMVSFNVFKEKVCFL
jgi:hypothetical protein